MRILSFLAGMLIAFVHITLTMILALGFLAFIVPGVLARQTLKLQ